MFTVWIFEIWIDIGILLLKKVVIVINYNKMYVEIFSFEVISHKQNFHHVSDAEIFCIETSDWEMFRDKLT